MDPTAQFTVFGLHLSGAEYQVLLEAIKATLFAGAGALIAFLFQSWGKKRELDTQLFNELVKPKIAALHDVNGRIAVLISAYLAKLKRVVQVAPEAGKEREDKEKTFETARAELDAYRSDAFLSGIEEIRAIAEGQRYVIGEASYRTIYQRLETLSAWVQDLWSHYILVGAPRVSDPRLSPDEYFGLTRFQYRVYARLSARKMMETINALTDDFETVIRTRGTSRIATLKVRAGIVGFMRELADFSDAHVQESVDRLERELMRSDRSQTTFSSSTNGG